MRVSCEYRYVHFERQAVPLYVLIPVYQYVINSIEPRAQAISTAAGVQTSGILSFRETVPLYVLILVYQHVISSAEPRVQAVSTAAAVLLVHIVGM